MRTVGNRRGYWSAAGGALVGGLIWAASMIAFVMLAIGILFVYKRLLPERSEFSRTYGGRFGAGSLCGGQAIRARYRDLYKRWRTEQHENVVGAEEFLGRHSDEA